MKTVIQVVLFLVALVLAYLIYSSIQKPIDFEKAKKVRYDATIERLKDIRKAQVSYKETYGQFTGSWDTLINFVKYDSVRNVRKIGTLTDSMIAEGISEAKALRLGLIIRDTTRESVLTTLFSEDYPIDEIKYIPLIEDSIEFKLGATVYTTGSGIKVPIFEARAHNNNILKGLPAEFDQLIINLNEQRRTNELYPGLKVGSLTEANNNSGNWE